MALLRTGFLLLYPTLLLWPATLLAQVAAPQATPAPPPASAPGTPPPPGYGPAWYGPPPGYAPAWGPPPSAPQPDIGAYRHDGFYLRLGTGLSYGHVRASGTISYLSDSSADLRATYDGWGPAYELLIGGTLGGGIVLGGGFVGQDISNPSIEVNSSDYSGSAEADGSLGVGALGPFIDWFPNDGKGLHFGTMLGVAILGLKNGSGQTSSGVAGSLWGGYDFWVSSQWSLGVETRLVAVRASRSLSGAYGGTLHDQAISAELLVSALYH